MVFCDFSVRYRPRRGEALRVSNEKRQDPVPLLHSPLLSRCRPNRLRLFAVMPSSHLVGALLRTGMPTPGEYKPRLPVLVPLPARLLTVTDFYARSSR